MALSRVVSEIINVAKFRDLEIGVRGHSRSLKVVSRDLETQVRGHSRSFKMSPCDRTPMTSY